jgi:two-component system NtrC family response regulator
MENVIERLLVLSSTNIIQEQDLPEELASAPAMTPALWPELPEEGISLDAVERELISRALEKFHGNQTRASRFLDISRRTLIYRIEKHGLAIADSNTGSASKSNKLTGFVKGSSSTF